TLVPALGSARRGDALVGYRRAHFGAASQHAFVDAAVYRRDLLVPGDELRGPAIVDGPVDTVVVPPPWQAVVGDRRGVHWTGIDVDGPGVDLSASGAFVAPDYSFSAGFAVPTAAGQTLTIRVTSVAPWGPSGEYGSAGEFRETTIVVQPPCDESGSTTTPPTTA